MEHRRAQRYRVSLPITFSWKSENTFHEGSGTTRDLSTRGAFVFTTNIVPNGSELRMNVPVPPIREGSRGSEMQGTGHVVRVQNEGFAAEAMIGFSGQSKSEAEIDHEKAGATGSSQKCVGAQRGAVQLV